MLRHQAAAAMKQVILNSAQQKLKKIVVQSGTK